MNHSSPSPSFCESEQYPMMEPPNRGARLFNTPFENMLRAILLLDAVSRPLNIDRIAAYDFLCIYGKTWDVLDKNLHGDNRFSFAEYRRKREVMREATALAVKYCLINVVPSAKGIEYEVNPRGTKLMGSIVSTYASEYRDFASSVNNCFQNITDEALLSFIKKGAEESEVGEYAELLD